MTGQEDFDEQTGSTSLTLLQRARQKEEVAWERLVELYAPLVYLRSRQQWQLAAADAENVGQDVFAAVARKLEDFDRNRKGSFRSWLRTIVDNKCRDHLRKKNPAEPVGGSTAQQALNDAAMETVAPSETDHDRNEKTILMRQAMKLVENEFSSRDWEIFWLVNVEERDRQSVAEKFGVTDNVVYLACYRIRKQLKLKFQDLIDDDLLGEEE